jgi:hypothetical protein
MNVSLTGILQISLFVTWRFVLVSFNKSNCLLFVSLLKRNISVHHSSGRLNFTDKFYTDEGLFFVASEFEGKSCINLHLHVNVIYV